ncbi:MAG: CHAT domain-containing protein [Acidimicrobiales bacterium]
MSRSRVDDFRALAASSIADASAAVERALVDDGSDPDLLYLLAELRARSGRALEALDLIERAEREFRRRGNGWDAERCEIGRITVLDDLGRHEDALLAATRQVERLADVEGEPDLGDLAVRARSNRGLCLETAGRYVEALDEYDVAIIEATRLDDLLLIARLKNNRSNVFDLLGRSQAALDDLRAASNVIADHGDRKDQVKIAANIGAVLCRRGEFDQGLEWFDRAERLVEAGTEDECGIWVETGDALVALGAVEEAALRFEAALDVLSAAPMSWLEGRAWMGLGSTAVMLGDDEAARRAFRSAHDSFQASDNHPWRVWALLELVRLESRAPVSRSLAVEQARRALALTDPGQWPLQAALALMCLADLCDADEVERHLRDALRISSRLALPPLTQRIEQRLGAHLLARARPSDAAVHVHAAVSAAETMRGRLHNFTLLRTLPVETAQAYDDLVELHLQRGLVAEAFAATDAARSRSLRDMGLDLRSDRHRDQRVAGLEAELHGVYDRLMGLDEPLTTELRRQLDDRARVLEAELDRAEFDIAPTASSGGAHAEPTAQGAEGIEVVYRMRAEEVGLFVHYDGAVEWFPSIASQRVVADELARLHADGRRARALVAAGVALPGALLDASAARLDRLGDMLLGPAAELLGQAGSRADDAPLLTVVPSGPLHGLPFHALGLNGRSVIDLATVVIAPSLSIRQQCQARQPSDGADLLVGVADAGVPGVIEEIGRLRAVLPRAQVLVDADATLQAVSDHSHGARLVHLATHGMFRSAAPLRSAVRLSDGWLTARRVSGLNLSGALVVLSACDTGRTFAAHGDELLGLQYGFIAAGARTIVMSLWPADDEITVGLMTTFHRAIADGRQHAAAMREAQLEIRSRNPHVWWWAPFVVCGAP